MQCRFLNILVVLFFGLAGMASAEFVVVGHRDLGVNKLTVAQVQAIWLGDQVTIGGTKMVAADLPSKHELHQDFLRDLLELTLKQYRVRTTRLAFNLQRSPPRVFKDQASVREWVARDTARVGYLRPEMVDSSVKVLLRVTD